MSASINAPDMAQLYQALTNGQVLLMLCDTIYGLVSPAPESFYKLQEIKGRPEGKPFLQIFANLEQLNAGPWQLPPERLQQYWPGPLTCILAPKPDIKSQIYLQSTDPYGQQDSQAVRIPKHSLLQQLALAIDAPLYSTSANRSGQKVPATIENLLTEFAPEIASGLILPYLLHQTKDDYKPTCASTIVDARSQPPRILRQGELILKL